MKTPLSRALAITAASAALLGLLHRLGWGLPLLGALAVVVLVLTWVVPWIGVRWLDDLILAARSIFWAREQGHFHSFAGIPLQVDDDGRHVWIDGQGLMRVLGRREPEDVLAARLAGHWRRDAEGRLMLRVDAVIAHLGTMPGRDQPRVLKLRRYLDRELLYPAQQRRARAEAGGR